MQLLSIPGMAVALWATSQTKTLRNVLFTPVVAVQQWLRQSRAVKQDDNTALADESLMRQTSSFVMLVESDVKEDIGGLLP
jgi:hypothetical protein